MIVSMIAAMSRNRVIGIDNGLPWDIPEDMKFFREKTRAHPCLMGRKTYESLGKPLPARPNLVITRQRGYSLNWPAGSNAQNSPQVDLAHPEKTSAQVFSSLNEALALLEKAYASADPKTEIFVIGGAEIYTQALPRADRIYLTVIDREFQGDAYFPEFSLSEFKEVERRDRTDPIPFSFLTFERK